ncbi:MAG TPA: selenide, water dikinase SelD [Bacteroidetes bacterium]|nr:selenide, water dikinase SelD [Bacteroidota bacterium]
MSLAELGQVLSQLSPIDHPAVLVGTNTTDDAGVYRLTDEIALIQTVDFFTPIVDDPYDFGRISAANSLSDVYAMGGKPICALNIVGYHVKYFGLDVLAEILKGGEAKAKEAGVPILGGHTIQDEEIKYGLAVTGIVHPDKVVTNAGARPGDVLVLTKPIGTGIITTALKNGVDLGQTLDEVVETMAVLNEGAADAMLEVGVHAATDVTGFGLLGHGHEMAKDSGVALRIRYSDVPRFEAALELAAESHVPGGTNNNRYYLQDTVTFDDSLSWEETTVLFDAQTSGGLLLAVEPGKVDALLEALKRRNTPAAAVIGEVVEGPAGRVFVER